MPPEVLDNNSSSKADTVDDILDTLFTESDNDSLDSDDTVEDDKSDKKPEKKLASKEDESDEEEDDEEDDKKKSDKDDEDEDEDEDELDKLNVDDDEDYQDVPSVPRLKKEFPELFKKFPGVRRAMYREAEYSKVFPSIKDAAEAKSALQTFNGLQSQIFNQGSLDELLGAVKQADEKVFRKIAGGVIDSIQRLDNDSYLNIAGLLLRRGLYSVKSASGKMKDKEQSEQLGFAAEIINEYFFGSPEISLPEVNTQREISQKPDEEISKREREFNQRQMQTAVQDVTEKVTGRLKDVVTQAIDPKEMMTPYVKSKAIKDVLDQVNDVIKNDFRFRSHLDKLWKSAEKDNFSSDALGKIRLSILNKAKTNLRDIVKQVRADALKGQSRSSGKSRNDDVRKEKFRGSDTQNNRSSNSGSKGEKLTGRNTMEKLFGSGD